MKPDSPAPVAYQPPALRVLGSVEELTGCAKQFGGSDGHTFQSQGIFCGSA